MPTDFWDTPANMYRTILDTETDYNGPIPESTYAQFRKLLEILFLHLADTGDSGTATSDPPNDTTGYFTDSASTWADDEHNGRVLLITSGIAKGQVFDIDDTDAANHRLICAGDNLYQAGVRSGDSYRVLYNIRHAGAHDHDALNSAQVVLADGQVTQPKLKTSQGSVSLSRAGSRVTGIYTLPGGEYGFYPQIKHVLQTGATSYGVGEMLGRNDYNDTTGCWFNQDEGNTPGTYGYGTYITLTATTNNSSYSATVYAQQRYVTSSGEVHWVFVLKDKVSGEIVSMWQAPDHPCFGNGGKPLLVQHPFESYDPEKHEIIVINPPPEEVRDILSACEVSVEDQPDKDFLEVISEHYRIDETTNPPWPEVPVTVGLPKVVGGKRVDDWRFMPREMTVEPIRRVIPQQFKTAKLRLRA